MQTRWSSEKGNFTSTMASTEPQSTCSVFTSTMASTEPQSKCSVFRSTDPHLNLSLTLALIGRPSRFIDPRTSLTKTTIGGSNYPQRTRKATKMPLRRSHGGRKVRIRAQGGRKVRIRAQGGRKVRIDSIRARSARTCGGGSWLRAECAARVYHLATPGQVLHGS